MVFIIAAMVEAVRFRGLSVRDDERGREEEIDRPLAKSDLSEQRDPLARRSGRKHETYKLICRQSDRCVFRYI